MTFRPIAIFPLHGLCAVSFCINTVAIARLYLKLNLLNLLLILDLELFLRLPP